MSFDGEQIFYTDQNLANNIQTDLQDRIYTNEEVLNKFKYFLKEWTKANSFVYRDQLIGNAASGRFFVRVDLDDINNFDMKLGWQVSRRPLEFHSTLEQAATETYCQLTLSELKEVRTFQVQIMSEQQPVPMRSLKSDLLGRLVTVQGIITSASKVQVKAKTLVIRCRNCGDTKRLEIGKGFASFLIPRICAKAVNTGQGSGDKCPMDPYYIIAEESEVMDQQTLKLQENPESIPTGEIPRTFQVFVDRYLVDKLVPGTRVSVTGVYTVLERKQVKLDTGAAGLKIPYLIVLGFQMNRIGARKYENSFTMEEEASFLEFAKKGGVYNRISKEIAAAIYGSEDVKKAIACLLFSGSRKFLPDNTKLRGDINILLIGDPSTAKSQFLKFVERVAPISIYTSGKGSSAAGLTASIIKDPASGEFQIEGGALVLADGGVVCIDEFDKMKASDRVAIHEAMEQQTISVAKAGITTILNSRTSVLAAANPVFGKYDDLKQISDQIDLQTTILSRFDCIFIVRDIRNEQHDKKLAGHIIDLHIGKGDMEIEEATMDLNWIKKYIAYAKSHYNPRLTEQTAAMLQNMYVEDRRKVQENKQTRKSHIPITVRQLEAIIRLSEALAKMSLSNQVNEDHVNEAHRLFQVSTMSAIQAGLDVGMDVPSELAGLVLKIEDSIKRRVAIGNKINHSKLMEEMTGRFMNQRAVEWALVNMIRREEFQHVEGRKILLRKK